MKRIFLVAFLLIGLAFFVNAENTDSFDNDVGLEQVADLAGPVNLMVFNVVSHDVVSQDITFYSTATVPFLVFQKHSDSNIVVDVSIKASMIYKKACLHYIPPNNLIVFSNCSGALPT